MLYIIKKQFKYIQSSNYIISVNILHVVWKFLKRVGRYSKQIITTHI